MSAAPRRVKNSLLSAAGEGFPYESYTENPLLVPVTPTTPAVLRDDTELDNFTGQEQPTLPSTAACSNIELTPPGARFEEPKTSSAQPSKQAGYFTSILSSLPNLSLSSITGESSQQQLAPQETRRPPGYVPSAEGRSTVRDQPGLGLLAANEPRGPNLLGPTTEISGTSAAVTVGQPTLPPTVPVSADGPVSYRLGSQRRLKYAPPPDLTLNVPKQYPTPPAVQQTFFQAATLTTVGPPSIFDPNETVAPSRIYNPVDSLGPPSEQTPNSGPAQGSVRPGANSYGSVTPQSLASQNSTPQSVTPQSVTPLSQAPYYETVPVSGRPSLSSSRPIPTQIPVPATPQNTPANVNLSGFELRTRQRELLATANLEPVEVVKSTGQVSRQELRFFEQGQIPESPENQTNSASGAENTFTAISALKVTEKLEHILAEQKERSRDHPAEIEESSQALVKPDTPNKDSSLTDVYLGEVEPSVEPAVFQEVTERAQLPDSWTSNTEPFQQYYQQKHQAPPVFNPNFFPGSKPESKSSLVSSASESSVSLPDPGISFSQSASSFFDTPGTGSVVSFPPEAPIQAFIPPPPTVSTSTLPNETAVAAVTEPLVPVPQTLWTQGTETSQSALNEPTAPLFYNPADFQTNYPPLPVSGTGQAASAEQPVGQTGQVFTHLLGSHRPQDVFNATTPLLMTASVPEPTGSATLNPVQLSANPLLTRQTTETVPPSLQNLAAGTTERRMQYRTVYHHWFYRKDVEQKVLWLPFSMQDSLQLEEVHNSSEITPETSVATDGGRYDVDILRRRRSPVYWTGPATEVRRCSWFFKGPTESRYVPYDEGTAAKLEEEFKQACLTNNWNRRIDLNNGEYIVFHSATVQVHYSQPTSPDLAASWGNSAGSEDSAYLQGAASRPRVIKRGLDEFHIEDGEPEKVDHLLFLVHGIGSVCDLKFRTVEEVVDEFRSISLQLVQSHYRTASERRIVNRIEVLPISWHTTLHSEDTGIDKKLQALTLESIPKLRHFTNDTLLDILFYTSPIYCQTIIKTVGDELNRLYALFLERNPGFNGGIYLGGHSLGSLILFDLLCHQKPIPTENADEDREERNNDEKPEEENVQPLPVPVLKRRLSKKISYVMGAAGTGQPYIHYPQLNFHPCAFFALGSPIGMFVTVRGIDTLGEDFTLPTCPSFFNIFHPFDPVAYRVEALINPEAHKYRPMLIPHHKGRKRMHLELKETMARVGADLKQKLLDSVRNTWNSVYQLALFHRSDNNALEREIDKVVEEQLQQTPTVPTDQTNNNEDGGADFKVGNLNSGRRIDYVLQEAPFEYINEYIFALTSHVCYWESEDTMLMILKEIYGSAGIQTDAQLPQQTLSIERSVSASPTILSPSTSSKNDLSLPLGIDPTAPISEKPVGPPPKTGFVRKS